MHVLCCSNLAANTGAVTQTSLTPRLRPKVAGNTPQTAAPQPAPTATATPRPVPAATATTAFPTDSSAGNCQVDAFGASRFTPAAPAPAPAATTSTPAAAAPGAAASQTRQRRRVPASDLVGAQAAARTAAATANSLAGAAPSQAGNSVSAAQSQLDAFGVPQFAPSANPATVPPVKSTGGVFSTPSSESFDPRENEDHGSVGSFNPRSTSDSAPASGTDLFGAPVFGDPTPVSSHTDVFDSTPFTAQLASSSSARNSTVDDVVVANPATNPFIMDSFNQAPPLQSSISVSETPVSASSSLGLSPDYGVDAFGAPVFRTRKASAHRRVSSDVTSALPAAARDPFDAAPFAPIPGPAVTTPVTNFNVQTTVQQPINSQSSEPLPGSHPQPLIPSLGQQPFVAPPAVTVVVPAPQQPAAPNANWELKQRELLKQREKLEERQRELLRQQQELSRQQHQLAHMQAQYNRTPSPAGQVLANPMMMMMQPSRPTLSFAHASSLSPSGARLAGAMLQQQQQQQHLVCNPGTIRTHSEAVSPATSPVWGHPSNSAFGDLM